MQYNDFEEGGWKKFLQPIWKWVRKGLSTAIGRRIIVGQVLTIYVFAVERNKEKEGEEG